MMNFIQKMKNKPSSAKAMAGDAGFTLIETLVAIFILTLTLGGLLTLAANGYYSVRYSRNQIVANNLIQESLEYVHNNRDTAIQQGMSWSQWIENFDVSTSGTILNSPMRQGCYTSDGCIVDPYSTVNQVRACNSACEFTTFYSSGLYGYTSSSYPLSASVGTPATTTYTRKITMQLQGTDQLIVTSTVTWMNGNTLKTSAQSILITNWK